MKRLGVLESELVPEEPVMMHNLGNDLIVHASGKAEGVSTGSCQARTEV